MKWNQFAKHNVKCVAVQSQYPARISPKPLFMHATEPSPICEGELCRPDLQNTPGNKHRKIICRSASTVKWRKDLGLATFTRCNTNYRELAFVEQFRSCRDNGLVQHIPPAVYGRS